MRFPNFTTVVLASLLSGCGGGSRNDGSNPPPPENLDARLAPLLVEAGAATPAPPLATTEEMMVLGRALFFDKELSGNRNISCSTCHEPTVGTSDGLCVSIGTGGSGIGADRELATGVFIPRNAPAVFDLANRTDMFWDSRVRVDAMGHLVTPEPSLNGPNPTRADIATPLENALQAQAMFPPTSRSEMRGLAGENELADATTMIETWDLIMARLVGTDGGTTGGIQAYRDLFAGAFPGVTSPDDFTMGHVGRALGTYQAHAFSTGDSPYDRYLRGDTQALSDGQKRGAILFFGRANCSACHDGPHLSNDRHHAIGIPQVGPGKNGADEDTGLHFATGSANDLYRFRTPGLRNVALSAPYMHDGCYTTLESTVRHYINPEAALRNYDPSQMPAPFQDQVDTDPGRIDMRAAAIDPLVKDGVQLNDAEVADLVAFLHALTDERALDLSSEIPASVPSGLPVGD